MSVDAAARAARALLAAYAESDPKRWPDHSICGWHTCGCRRTRRDVGIHARTEVCHRKADYRRALADGSAAEGEPPAPEPRETPLKCRWCGQTDWLTTEDIVAAYRAYGRAPESREAGT